MGQDLPANWRRQHKDVQDYVQDYVHMTNQGAFGSPFFMLED